MWERRRLRSQPRPWPTQRRSAAVAGTPHWRAPVHRLGRIFRHSGVTRWLVPAAATSKRAFASLRHTALCRARLTVESDRSSSRPLYHGLSAGGFGGHRPPPHVSGSSDSGGVCLLIG